MKEFFKSRIGKSVVFAVSVMIAAFIMWPLLDLFYCNVITNTEFVWSVRSHIVTPIILSIVCGFVEYFWLGHKAKRAGKTKK